MIIGGHVSAAGGVVKAVSRANALSFDAFQIHPTAPQSWRQFSLDDEDAEAFKQEICKSHIKAVFFHNIYLTNFASSVDNIWHGSISITRNYLQTGHRLHAQGVITHLGSHKGSGMPAVMPRLVEGITRAMEDNLYPDCHFIIENTAGGGDTIGISIDEIANIIEALPQELRPHVDVCIDTCHALAAGIPLNTKEGLDSFLKEFDQRLGLSKLACIHLNDSMYEAGSRRDRHANITQGQFGAEALAYVLTHPSLTNTPFIMEVPGIEKTGPDSWNRDRVYELANLPLPDAA